MAAADTTVVGAITAVADIQYRAGTGLMSISVMANATPTGRCRRSFNRGDKAATTTGTAIDGATITKTDGINPKGQLLRNVT